MLPFRIASVVACDDIRQEQNNKAILIGVYNGTVVVQGFPAEVGLSWWIQMKSDVVGHFDIDLQAVLDGKSTVLRARVVVDVAQAGWVSLSLPRAPIQLQGEGQMKLQMKLLDDKDWVTVQELDIVRGQLN